MNNVTQINLKEKIKQLLIESKFDGIFPVPVIKIAEYLGFSCHLFTPGSDASHISGAVGHLEKKIYVNNNDSMSRQRFTIAHEIGHIILHGKNEDHIDYRDASSSPKETEADNFAAQLLMPEELFTYQWKKTNDINQVAKFFGVSVPAAGVRASKLSLE